MQSNMATAGIMFARRETAVTVERQADPEASERAVDFAELVEDGVRRTERPHHDRAERTEAETKSESETDSENMKTERPEGSEPQSRVEHETDSDPEESGNLMDAADSHPERVLEKISQETLDALLESTETGKPIVMDGESKPVHAEDRVGKQDLESAAMQTGNVKRSNLGAAVLEDAFPDGWEVLLEETPEGEAVRTAPKQGASNPGLALQPAVTPARTVPAELEENPELPLDLVTTAKADPDAETAPATEIRKPAAREWTPDIKAARVMAQDTTYDVRPAAEVRIEEHAAVAAKAQGAVPAGTTDTGTGTQDAQIIESMHSKSPETFSAGMTARVAATTPAQLLARMDAVQKRMVVEDFVQATKQGVQGREDRLIVELHPPELGRIRVRLDSHGDQLSAQLTLQDRHVGEFFQERLESIRKSLESAGIRLHDLSVEVQQQFTRETPQEKGDARGIHGSAAGGNTAAGTQGPKHSPSGRTAVLSGKVDMLV